MCPLPFPALTVGEQKMDRQFQWRREETDREREKVTERLGDMSQGGVGCVKMEGRWCFCCLSISAILVGGVGVGRGAVWLLAIFAGRHPLVYSVQATCLLEVANLPRGRKALNG